IQFSGNAHRTFTYQMLGAVRELLEKGVGEDAKPWTLSDMETNWCIRVITGGPPHSGSVDPDGLGIGEWTPAIYCAGNDPRRALQLIFDTLTLRSRKKSVHDLPQLKLWCDGLPGFDVPEPWSLCGGGDVSPPRPFSVLPPKGRRHILAQLEAQPCEEQENRDTEEEGEEVEEKYILSFFGGIYAFKDRFDEHQVPGVLVSKEGTDQREYIRFLNGLKLNDEHSASRVRTVLEDVLLEIPVFFINNTSPANQMAALILTHASVVRGEDVDV
ncbi:Uncharacterized protein SCF082_LOCUS52787, partial [Durusdinium trenchii]